MTEHEKPRGHLFIGLLIGGTLGVLAGVLFAPKSGKELRSEIKEKGSAVLKDAKNIYADCTTKAKQMANSIAIRGFMIVTFLLRFTVSLRFIFP
jgi:gas vesicle protein